LSLKYNYLQRISQFTYPSFNANISYDWTKNQFQHNFNILNASLLLPNPDTAYQNNVLNRSQLLQNAFKPYVIFGLFGGYTWVYNGIDSKTRPGWWIRLHGEAAGNMVNVLDRIFSPGDTLKFFNGKVNYSQYIEADGEARYFLPIGKKSSFNSRFYGGIGVPYGNSNALPYVRQFYSGGTNSIRAWRVRELGPGSYRPVIDPNVRLDLTGDMRLEANAEIRFPLIYYLEGALFVDAGNIWTLRKDPGGPGKEFDITRFWDEIAVGAGAGLRLNFSYFIIRFDLAAKIHSPYTLPIWGDSKWRNEFILSNLTYNLAVGYPF
jgi:outer membrane protein assembly factor BamA